MRKVLLFALVLRLLLAPLVNHCDVVDSLNWGKNLEEFGLQSFYSRDIPDAGPANYPPGFYYLLSINQEFYQIARRSLWLINVKVPPFPSNFYLWFESNNGRIFFNKLPVIFADLGIGYLIYLLVSQIKNKKAALISSSAFLFSPPIWYNSAVWGQTESLFGLPLLASFYGLYKKKYVLASLLFLLSFLIKPTILLVAPLFLIWWLRNSDEKSIVEGMVLAAILLYLVHIPFHPQATFDWILWFYQHGTREILGYLTANAFNFWALFFGFEPVPANRVLLGIPANVWGLTFFGTIVVYFFKLIKKRQNVKIYFFLAALLYF
jgi:dolichyl-phosphate-mannose-protein mannosyltransferase